MGGALGSDDAAVAEVAERRGIGSEATKVDDACVPDACRPLDALASLLKTHRMDTDKASARSSGRPVAGKRVDGPECGQPALMSGSASGTDYPQTELSHSVTVAGDIAGPVIPEEHWESLGP